MEHRDARDVKCLAWHPKDLRGKHHVAVRDVRLKTYSVDPCIGFLRRHDQALHRRSVGRLVLFHDIDRSRFDGLVPSMDYLASSSDDLTIRIWKRTGTNGSLFINSRVTREVYTLSVGVPE